MTQHPRSIGLGTVVVLGSVWGLTEAGLGFVLESCARLVSGSVMTGVALLFIAAAWSRTRRVSGPALAVGIALAFKLFDALLLGLPIRHGAVANPMFSFVLEGAAFLIFIPFLAEAWKGRVLGRAFWGGASALLAVNLFPLVKFATGIPACVAPGGTMPLSLYYAPIAVGLSALAVPLGLRLGEMAGLAERALSARLRPAFEPLLPAGAAILCLAAAAALRLV